MTENRGLFIALGVALVSIGLGGYVSLRVGETLSSHASAGTGISSICLWVAVAGAIILIALQGVFAHRWYVKRTFFIITGKGHILYLKAKDYDPSKDADFAQLKNLLAEYDSWRDASTVWMVRHNRNAAAQFANQSGLLLLQGIVGGQGANQVLVLIDTRLTRLNEIANRL